MPKIEVKYSEGDKIWLPARITYAEIHQGKVYYHIENDDNILVEQDLIIKREEPGKEDID